MSAEARRPGDLLPPGETIREAFYQPKLGVVLIGARPAHYGVKPTYWRTRVDEPADEYLAHLSTWLWQHYGAGLPDGPCWN